MKSSDAYGLPKRPILPYTVGTGFMGSRCNILQFRSSIIKSSSFIRSLKVPEGGITVYPLLSSLLTFDIKMSLPSDF